MEKSRRQLIQTAFVALPALGALRALADEKAPTTKIQPATHPTFKLSKNNIGHLTNALYNNPAERQKFLADPKGFAENLFRARLDASEAQKLQDIQKMLADGFCCGGCGCSMPFGAQLENVAR